MKIQSIFIDGYKNLSNVRIKLDDITALVALNNFGKSNVLSAIEFGLEFIKASKQIKSIMTKDMRNIPNNKNFYAKNFSFEIQVKTKLNKRQCEVIYGYEFEWENEDRADKNIVSEYLKIKSDINKKYTQLLKRDGNVAYYKSSETGRCSTSIQIEKKELLINKISAFDALYYIDVIKKINNIKIYMENTLDARDCYRPNPIIIKGLEEEMISESNLPKIIYKLKETYEEKFDLLVDVFKSLFNSVDELIVDKVDISGNKNDVPEDAPFIFSDSIYLLRVKDKNLLTNVDFSTMSDGAKRVFMILTKIIVSSISDISLIAIEEPENCVHPTLFNSYIKIIHQLLDDCKVIITSHSPYVVSYLKPSWIHIGVNQDNGLAEFFTFKKTAQKQIEKEADSFDMNMGDYIFSLLSDKDDAILEYLERDN